MEIVYGAYKGDIGVVTVRAAASRVWPGGFGVVFGNGGRAVGGLGCV